jgi:hypothetical protein
MHTRPALRNLLLVPLARVPSISREDFRFDRDHDIYTCPAGKVLTTTGAIDNDLLRYRASKLDCNLGSLKMQCCPKEPVRKILRSIYAVSMKMPATSLVHAFTHKDETYLFDFTHCPPRRQFLAPQSERWE